MPARSGEYLSLSTHMKSKNSSGKSRNSSTGLAKRPSRLHNGIKSQNISNTRTQRSGTGGEHRQRSSGLCAQAAVEQDPQKLTALVSELADLLEQKERQLGILLSRKMDSEAQKF